jgi:hypothetical protein
VLGGLSGKKATHLPTSAKVKKDRAVPAHPHMSSMATDLCNITVTRFFYMHVNIVFWLLIDPHATVLDSPRVVTRVAVFLHINPGLDDLMSVLGEGPMFSLLCCIWTSSGTYPVSDPMGLGGKQAGREIDHLTPSMLRMFTAHLPKGLHHVVLN